nr:FtsX-like permease family protein [Isoptericola halotolerans]
MVGLAVVAVSDLSGRRAEVAVLRAAGVGPRSQAAGRALESGAVGAAALLAGSGAGWSVAAVAVPGLVGSVLDVARPGFTVDVGLVVALVGAAAAGTAAVAAALTWRVAAQARDTGYRPEVR